MASYIDDDRDRNVDDGLSGYHIAFGKELDASRSVELNAILAFHNADGFDADQEQWGLGVDYVRRFGKAEYFAPYVLAGGGFITTQNKNSLAKDGSGFMASLGVGVLTPLDWFDLQLRTELRIRADYSASTRQDVMLSFGLQRSVRPKPVVIMDSDQDGVPDPDDRCEDTPDTKVDRHGCARTRD